ncbi:MAG: hypothetical protein DLM53_02180 [Candidatus Eremiobacter antarcticus]|nr:hypothetical protein [Candidatus Eremiobacteraeota bacterium]MBC5808215.1 hypothetical protein [Candidatus Eremiobacteraeota bacterium]PZR63604.1 MAG: hypothetical protein DLM53_02180 [Candidatus Eremiobacter sp. RRmetagenome_bin22]
MAAHSLACLKHAALACTCALALGAAFGGRLHSLTTEALPAVVLSAVTCLGSLGRSHVRERTVHRHPLLWWALLAGFGFSALLPRSPLPPLSVMTHAPDRMQQRRHAAPRRDRADDDDASLFDALERIDRDSASVVGTWLQVTGTWTRAHDGAPATVSRQIMTCCAADSVAVGFDVTPDTTDAAVTELPASGAYVQVSGRMRASMVDGETRYSIGNAAVTTLRTAGSR